MATEPTPTSLISFNPTSIESESSKYFFIKADTDSIGVLTGDQAVPFLSHADLPPTLLGEVWQISDPDNSGFLTPQRFAVACRLIAHAQAGPRNADIKLEWLSLPGPLPKFEGFPLPAHLANAASPSTPQIAPRIVPQSTGQHDQNVITPEEKVRYANLFQSSGPKDGLLDGEAAQVIFVKSKLPFDVLGQIWNLADTRNRGSLDVTDFTIAMHLIQHKMNNTLPVLPTVLSPALYASALSLPTPATTSTMRSSANSPRQNLSYAPVTTLSPQVTGQSFNSSQQNRSQQSSAIFAPQQQQQQQQQSQFRPAISTQWDISAQEKAEADKYFAGLDPTNKGVVEGDMALPFMMASRLPVEVLAVVWELADIRGQGALNRDEFAVAMRLIVDKQAGKELPATLPASMIPPSLRGNQQQQQQQKDLLSLDDEDDVPLSALPPAPIRSNTILSPQQTGNSAFSNSALQGTIFPQATGMSNRSQPPTSVFAQATLPPLAPTSSSFLDEVDHAERTSLLASRSAALETVQADHASTTASLANLTTQRATLEEALSVTTASLNQLHASLSTARAAYEEERLLVDSLSERQASQSSLLSRARAELISAESDLSGVRVTRGEIEGGYLRDKEELRGLTFRAAEVEKELEKEKIALEKETNDGEKIRDEARTVREKLSAMEFERGTIAQDLIGVREVNSKASEAEASSPFDHISPTSLATKEEGVEKPALTTVKSNNPFDRMTSLLSSSTPSSPSSAPLTSPTAVPAFSPTSTTRSTESATGSPISTQVVAGSAAAAVAGAAVAIGFGIEGVDAEREDNDPFGMPIVNDKKEEEKSSFDNMFGDDFSSTSAPVSETISPESITTEAKGKGKEVVEEDSSDDDDEAEEIEEATPATPRRSIPAATNTTYASVAGHTQEKSSSDSSSFVHVSAFSDSNEVESKFPALDEEEATVVATPTSDSATMQQVESEHASKVGSEIDRSPKSDVDLFEDATAGTDDDHGLPTSPAQPTEPSNSMMMGAGAGLIAGGTAAAVVAAKKRTAPPPPPSRSATIPLSGLNASSTLALNPATTVSPGTINAADDFDKAFDDFPTTKSTAANTASAFGGTPKGADTDFDDFDDEFDDAFGTSTSPVKSPVTKTAVPATSRSTSSAFDDSFADFDSAFDPPSSKSPAPPTFDSLISSTPNLAPKLPGRPSAPPPTIARPDDVKGIKDIVAMGFTRDQAVTALESHNYDVSEAIDSLL